MIVMYIGLFFSGATAVALQLLIIFAAAFWAGYRISSMNKNLVLVATAGAALPIIGMTFLGVAVWIEAGRSPFSELINSAAISRGIGMLFLAAAFSILGRTFRTKDKAK